MVRKVLGSAVTAVLVVTAVGLVSWFAYAQVANATLITFRTGSMSPSMPQGSLAVTLPTAAAAVERGDVVTVQRVTADMPVTHRVVDVREASPREPNSADMRAAAPDGAPPDPTQPGEPVDPAARELVLQGDDNDTADAMPYVANDVRTVVFSVPRLGTALMLVQTPLGMGILILGVGTLVTWAFWPSRPGSGSPVTDAAELDPEPKPEAEIRPQPHLTKS